LLVLKTAILSAWSRLVRFLAAVREQFLHLWGKFLDWLTRRKKKNPSAGRPTIEDHLLIAQRIIIHDMLSCWWGEVGWQIPRATTRDELRASLAPLNAHADRNRINRLLAPTVVSAGAEEIREAREANKQLIAMIYETQDRQRVCADFLGKAQMALGHASPNQRDAVKAEISKRQADLEEANKKHRSACDDQARFQNEIDLMEAGFAQDELLKFIDKRFIKGKYARNPRNLADAIAGLPWAYGIHFLGAWQSYARCSKIDCSPHPRFQLFETIQSIWNKARKSTIPLLEFFQQEISTLQQTRAVKKLDPITGEEFNDKELNWVRHTLENDWPIWKLAIRKSFEFQVEIERVPFLICANFTKVQQDPGTAVVLVLGEKDKN